MVDHIHIGTRKGLFTVERANGAWHITDTAFLGDNCSAILADSRDGARYVALDHGHFGVKLQRSRDGGVSWHEIAAPTYPQKPDDEEPWTDPFGREIPYSLELAWVLEAGHRDAPGELWCGTMPGGLFRSSDHGDSWTLVQSLWDNPLRRKWFGGGADYPGIHSLCVHPSDPNHITLAISCGGVWETTDRGESWACIGEGWRSEYMPPESAGDPTNQDPHRVVQCRARPTRLWAQHHNGIFRSDDRGRTWQELSNVTPSAFGFAVAVHPEDPDTAWFVPAIKDEQRIPVDGRVVVIRTRDGGKTFETLCDGLPQTHAYDLVFRHAMDIDDTGNALAFGSTTGSLWVSDDQGDHWQCLSQHLPPIYAVRFEP